MQQQPAHSFPRRSPGHALDDRLQRPTGHVLHVQQRQACLRQFPLVVDPNDIRVIELSQGLGLGSVTGRHLERHQPLHRPLPGQEHGGEGTSAEMSLQVEVVNALARLQAGKSHPCWRRRGHGRIAGQQRAQLGRELGKAAEEFVRQAGLTQPLANVELFIDQTSRQVLAAQLRVGFHVFLDVRPFLPQAPAVIEIEFDQLDQDQPAQRRWSGGQEIAKGRGLAAGLAGADVGIEEALHDQPGLAGSGQGGHDRWQGIRHHTLSATLGKDQDPLVSSPSQLGRQV